MGQGKNQQLADGGDDHRSGEQLHAGHAQQYHDHMPHGVSHRVEKAVQLVEIASPGIDGVDAQIAALVLDDAAKHGEGQDQH